MFTPGIAAVRGLGASVIGAVNAFTRLTPHATGLLKFSGFQGVSRIADNYAIQHGFEPRFAAGNAQQAAAPAISPPPAARPSGPSA